MSIPYNETQVIQTALNLLGYPLVQSKLAGGKAAETLRNLYEVLMAADLSSPNWRFSTKVKQLSQIAGFSPNYKWYTCAYQLPPDMLALWQIYPNVPFEIYGEQLWTQYGYPPPSTPPPNPLPTGSTMLQIEYRALVPPSMLPPSYIMYFCYLLAVTAGPAITDDPKILAQLNADMAKWRAQAMVTNSQGHPNIGLTNSSWVTSRRSGSFFGTGNQGGAN